MRENSTLEERWVADKEVQAGTDRDRALASAVQHAAPALGARLGFLCLYRKGYTFKTDIPKRPWFCEACNAIAKAEAEVAKLAGPVRGKNESARDYRGRVKRWREH